MKLFFSGGNHDDPLHRLRLCAGMEFLRDNYGDPTFVAVEANRTLFQAVTLWQRHQFVRLGSKDEKLSCLRLDKLKSLAKTIHYEADSHEALFRSSPKVIWLDDERSFHTTGDPCATAERYLDLCRKALENEKPSQSEQRVMQAISKFIITTRADMTTAKSFDRDEAWARMILAEKVCEPGYGIVVVGEDHVQNKEAYLGALLAAEGNECQTRYLANATIGHDNWSTTSIS